MRDYLEREGFNVKSPRQTIKTAIQAELIYDGHVWIDALEKRNLMAHTYDENKAIEEENLIRDKYYDIILNLCVKMEGLL